MPRTLRCMAVTGSFQMTTSEWKIQPAATNARINSLIIAAPKETMQVIEKLIETLDTVAAARAYVNVFRLQQGADATLTANLKASGAIIIAKAAMGEFASGYLSSAAGAIRNPYDPKRHASGSSGG